MHAGDYNYALERDQKKDKWRVIHQARGRPAAALERTKGTSVTFASTTSQAVVDAHRPTAPHNASNAVWKATDPDLATRKEGTQHNEQQVDVLGMDKQLMVPAPPRISLGLQDQAAQLTAQERRQPEASCMPKSGQEDARAMAEKHYAQGYAMRKAV
jgi:hypothetical protein